MRLEKANPENIERIRGWFITAESILTWGGPGVRFPNTRASFLQDLDLNRLDSYLLYDGDKLLGFGQIYARLERCHLARLAIAPEHRGRGHITYLVELLRAEGIRKLKLSQASLFVVRDNLIAINAYRKLGFVERHYPGEIGMENCVYMITEID